MRQRQGNKTAESEGAEGSERGTGERLVSAGAGEAGSDSESCDFWVLEEDVQR